jgi:hypothetical protein
LEAVNGKCQAWELIRYVDLDAAKACYGTATECHEPLTRARGGSTDDPVNAVCICRSCHNWAHANEGQAWRVGLMLKSWESEDNGHLRRCDIYQYGLRAVEPLEGE